MAGGLMAVYVACMKCAKKAKRTSDGLETDWYECESCGHKFGITWEETPKVPCWPITEKETKEIIEFNQKLKMQPTK